MNPLVRRRRIDTPPGYAERDCRRVSYAMPFCPHCFVLCHEPSDRDHPAIDYDIMDFFMQEAHALSREITGHPHAFVVIHSGRSVRKRPNLHMHVFVIRRRWQKAWLYALLAGIHSVSALRRALLRIGRHAAASASTPSSGSPRI